jgi:hypothetical protein
MLYFIYYYAIMLSVIMLNFVMLSVIMLSVMAPACITDIMIVNDDPIVFNK